MALSRCAMERAFKLAGLGSVHEGVETVHVDIDFADDGDGLNPARLTPTPEGDFGDAQVFSDGISGA